VEARGYAEIEEVMKKNRRTGGIARGSGRLERLHAGVRENRWLGLFTWFTRGLLALGFLPPGLTKLLNIPFTRLPTDHPVGYFFDAFYTAGLWYNFVGACQVAAAILLLTPWTATLGAVIYFPIILNIFVITVSIDFAGTPIITGLMLLACVYLLCWDYDRLRHLLPAFPKREGPEAAADPYNSSSGGG
jgi:uncharacterized membrane protein YphA (DoxX/SURF4 family)